MVPALRKRTHLPYLTGACGALLIAFSAIFVRLADVAPATAAVFRCAYALPILALLAASEHRRYGPRPEGGRRAGLLAGVFFGADLLLWHYTIDLVGAGLSTVLANTQVVIVGLVAWLVLGERPHRHVLFAVPIVLGGVVLISGVLEADAFGDNPLLGVLLGLATAVAYSGFILTLRSGNRDPRRRAGPLFDASLSGAACSLVAGLALGNVSLAPVWPAHGWLLLLALNSQVLAWMLISYGLPRLPAVVTSLLLMIQPVGAVALGVALLAERPSPAQIAGTAVVIAGIVVASLRPRRRRPVPAVDEPPAHP